jgi:hypothetical protein
MNGAKLWAGAALMLALLAPGGAHAQTILTNSQAPFPYGGHDPGTDPDAEEPDDLFQRFRIGVGLAIWEIGPFSQDEELGPFVEGEFYVTPQISIGGWYSHVEGDLRSGRVFTFGGGPRGGTDFEADMFDVHLAYHFTGSDPLTSGWSLQVGYGMTEVDVAGGTGDASSVNFWANKRTYLGGLGSDARHPVTLITGIGYYPGDDFYEGGHVLLGLSIGLTDNISLVGSAWLYQIFARPDRLGDDTNSYRFTVGLAGGFR